MMVLRAQRISGIHNSKSIHNKVFNLSGITNGNTHNENHIAVVKEFEQNMKFIMKESNGTFIVSANSIPPQIMATNLCRMDEGLI